MVFDFHTHVFPDKIAAKTIDKLEGYANIKAFTDGTLEGLKKSMKAGNIDCSIILPVLTKAEQFHTVNQYAALLNQREENLISFGGIHPDSPDYKKELDEIKELGLKGIKLHPDYQQTRIDHPKNMRIIEYADELGLIISVHAGVDIGLPIPVHCDPAGLITVLKKISPKKLVVAHCGGFRMWDEVEEVLVGENIYLDTSFSLDYMNATQFERIVKNHGADKIIFASDSPWSGQAETLQTIRSMNISSDDMEKILHGNAEELLNI